MTPCIIYVELLILVSLQSPVDGFPKTIATPNLISYKPPLQVLPSTCQWLREKNRSCWKTVKYVHWLYLKEDHLQTVRIKLLQGLASCTPQSREGSRLFYYTPLIYTSFLASMSKFINKKLLNESYTLS